MDKRNSISTEKDRMKRILICKLCHETLEDPIILPCGKTICSKHLLNETNNFKCDLCDNSHDKTVDKFPANEALNELLQICDEYVNLNSIDLGEDYKLAKEKLKNLNDLIRESELLIKDSAFYIDDYFTKLRNEIDLSKEQLIEDIEHKHEQIINELKQIESKCKQNAQNKESNNKLEQTIESTKESLNEYTETLETNLNRGDFCNTITKEFGLLISELKYEMNKCQVALLDNKEYKFNSFLIEDTIFGDLETNEVEIVDESRLEGTIRFEIKDFSKFRHKFNKPQLIDQWLVVKNIQWLIGVEMNEIDSDIYLAILLKPLGLTEQFLESNPIETDISLKMVKTNGESYGHQNYNEKFDNVIVRLVELVSLKNIMNPTNSLYNEQTNSETFEAQIKIID